MDVLFYTYYKIKLFQFNCYIVYIKLQIEKQITQKMFLTANVVSNVL